MKWQGLCWMFVSAACLVAMVGCRRGAEDKIERVSRQNNSGTYVYFREEVLGKDRDYKLGSYDQSGSKDVVELVAKTPNAIGYSGMGYATDDVKMLKLSKKKGGEGVAPTLENAKKPAGDPEHYPLARKLYIYTLDEPTGAAKHFLDWTRTKEGQDIVLRIGYVPVEAQEMPPDTPDPPDGTVKMDGSDTMVNLAQAWAEAYNKKYPNVSVQVGGGGSGVGIAKLIDGTTELANASRDMKPDEKDKAEANSGKTVKEHVVALDALAVYVHKDNPLDSISLEELAEIYGDGGEIVRWSQVEGWPADGNDTK